MQGFGIAMQEFIVHAMNVLSYTDHNALVAQCDANNCEDFQKSTNYILVNGAHNLKDTAEKLVFSVYDGFLSSTDDDKLVLNVISAIAMGATLLCYLIIIPRILSVIRQKSEVMQIFGDITDDSIKDMLNSINQISIQTVAFDSRLEIKQRMKEEDEKKKVVQLKENISKEPAPRANMTKLTEEPAGLTTQNIIPTEAKNMEALTRSLKKRDCLSHSGYFFTVLYKNSGDIRRTSLITITLTAIFMWLFFGGAIALDELIFKYFKEITKALRAVALRRPCLTLQVLILRELLFDDDIEQEQELLKYNQLYRNLEAEAQNFLQTGPSIMQGYKDEFNAFNSENFCECLKPRLTEQVYSNCKEFENGALRRGFSANVFQVLSHIDALLNIYRSNSEQGIESFSLMNDPKYDYNCIFFIINSKSICKNIFPRRSI